MNVRVTRIALVCVGLLFAGLVLTGQSTAKLDSTIIAGLWLFDEGTGEVVKDSSGNGLDGKLVGKPEWVDGVFGKALELDGAGSYVEIPEHANPTEAITVSAWVKSATAGWNQHGWIVEKRNAFIIHPNQGTVNVAFPICNGGCWNKPGGWSDGAIGPKDITEWHMYTGTFDSNTGEWKLYIDGEEKSTLDLDKVPIDEDIGPLYIGNDTCCAGRFGAGTVDEVAIFNVALSQDEIQSIMKDGLFFSALAVGPAGKLTTTWADVRTQY